MPIRPPGPRKTVMHDTLFNLSALLALVPACIVGWRRQPAPDVLYWLVLAVGIAGPLAWVVVQDAGAWRPGFSTTLWVIIAASLAVFAAAAARLPQAWRLLPLLAPYLLIVGGLATIWYHAPKAALTTVAPTAWVHAHILVSVVTYGLLTVAAVAELAAFFQERALKRKRPTTLTRRLPAVADCEALAVRLLVIGEIILALGLMTGMAMQYAKSGALLTFDHKTVLTIAAFLVIGILLVAHFRSGVRGRVAARLVLVAYLLLTLGYPGVKFVTDVLMA